jgi:hypothetical protein
MFPGLGQVLHQYMEHILPNAASLATAAVPAAVGVFRFAVGWTG